MHSSFSGGNGGGEGQRLSSLGRTPVSRAHSGELTLPQRSGPSYSSQSGRLDHPSVSFGYEASLGVRSYSGNTDDPEADSKHGRHAGGYNGGVGYGGEGRRQGHGEHHSDATEAALKAFEENDKKSWHFRLGGSKWGLRFNPLTTLISIILIWGFIAWCIAQPAEALAGLARAKAWISDVWSWLYIGTQTAWVLMLAGVYFSKYADMKLGGPDDEPEFSTASWFFMLFSSGVAVGFFYYGVGETVWHYEPCYGAQFAGVAAECTGQSSSAHRFATMEDNVRAQLALTITLFHWGLHAWVTYALVGLLLALLTYRQGLPMTIKSAFYPLIGERIYGWMGDLVDVLSVITTLFGICTSLGLGVLQLNTGLRLFSPVIKEDTTSQIIIIWVITVISTVSCVSGIHLGIRRLSEMTWAVSAFLLCCLFFAGPSFYFLSLYVQSWGWYLWLLIPLSFQTDAIAHLDIAPDGRGAGATWMNDWTIFYWGWWISWAPFVGMFAAKISRGRTVREFLNGMVVVPILYTFLWFVVLGGAGLQMEREAARQGVMCSYSAGLSSDTPVGFVCLSPNGVAVEGAKVADPYTGMSESCAPGFSKISRLSCFSAERQYFLLWEQFSSYRFFGILSIAVLIPSFATSSDSASLVIDCITSNGNPHPPIFQRVFWALTEGAAACALLIAGGRQAVNAVQTASILAALPYTFILCFMCPALWNVLKQEGGDWDHGQATFHCHLVDPITSPGMSTHRWVALGRAVVAPCVDVGRAGASQHQDSSSFVRVMEYITAAAPFYTWILLMALIPVASAANIDISPIAWSFYIAFVANVTRLRINARKVRGIAGHYSTDFIAALVAYPLVAVQLGEEVAANGPLSPKQT